MSILEELWYGNISPMEISHIEDKPKYKETMQLVNSNSERLKETLMAEQLELLLRYCDSRNELSNITELDAFKTGFKLGVGIVIETITELYD